MAMNMVNVRILKARRLVFLFFALSCLIGQAFAADDGSESLRVLAIHSYSQEYPWTSGQHIGFVQTLEKSLPSTPTIKTEYLDTKRKALDAAYGEDFIRYLGVKYGRFTPDAIYVTDDNALNFAVGPLSVLFANVPVFFSGVNDFSHLGRLDPDRVTGVFEEKEILPNLELLHHLLGQTGRITVVGDGSVTYRAIEERLKKEIGGNRDIVVNFIVSDQLDIIQNALARDPGSPVLLTTLGAVRGDTGNVLSLDKIIAGIVQSGPQVVISMEDVYIFEGVLGGYVTSSPAQGSSAANLLLKYISGRPLSELTPVTRSPNEYVFNDRVLESLKVDLPKEITATARLLNPRDSFYERYKKLILGLTTFLGAALLASAILYLFTLRVKNRQLLESEERFSTAFRASPSMFVISDPGQGLTVDVSESCVEILGYSREEMIGKTAAELKVWADPDDRRRFIDRLQRDGSVRNFETRHRTKNDDFRNLVMSAEHIEVAGKPQMLLAGHDITERKRTEEALEESEARNRRILEAAGEGIYGLDMEGKTTFVNTAAAKMIGWNPEDLIGKPQHDILHHTRADGSPYPREECHVYAAFRDGKVHTIADEVFWRKDGTSFPVEYTSTPVLENEKLAGAVVVFRDISKRKLAEKKLRKAYDELEQRIEERTQELTEEIRERRTIEAELLDRTELLQLLYKVTTIANEAENVDQAMENCLQEICEYMGWPVGHIYTVSQANPDRLVPKGTWYVKGSQQFSAFREITMNTEFNKGVGMPGRVLASGEPEWIEDVTGNPEFPRWTPDKDIGLKSCFGFPIKVKNNVVAVMEFFSPEAYKVNPLLLKSIEQVGNHMGHLAERAEAESSLSKAKDHAEVASRAKSDLLANMSHELRTPLNAIIGFSGTMKEETFGPLGEKYMEYTNDIKASGEHLLELINDILDVSAIEAGKLELHAENLDVGKVVEATMHMINDRADEGSIHLTVNTDDGLPKLHADRRRLMQMLLNLLSNAIKFTPPGGEVSLTS